ncbi:hypothetical protein DBR23_17665 [Acidovorax sp. HMWF018]|uniref:hypothetical protein n=1 Tax=Acidovorax sp. HMWF018 TaxID=2056855 RepID=UPI000D37EF93|nr:hypothetical protein [Acidovorax sp. HMWF018]PTT37392.1 hypothetical protein DBR23_17665 [Acidovorax sp. HMWF018]
MASIAGYAYFSRAENYNYIPVGDPESWSAAVRVYAVYDDGTVTFLNAGTYTAGLTDGAGLRFGYVPLPESLVGNPTYEAYYGISPSGLVFPNLNNPTERAYVVELKTGVSLLDPELCDISALAPGAVDSGANYISVSVWEAPPDEYSSFPSPQVVVAAVEITAAFWSGISTISDADRVLYVVSRLGAVVPPPTPPFWTGLTGTEETP